ncbi:MAG: aminotransferase class V-fold PLP-dependent enzyme [Saprospiraceae bacterium]|nr:aminotransferase class V-fold PLP-dependent enzyme [Saprospiraceae bacterium]
MECKRSEFQLKPGVTYLNCAYQSPISSRVVKAGESGLQVKTNPQNISASDFFSGLETLKQNFARLIKSDDPERIAYHPSASYGFAVVAKNLPVKKKGRILMPASQFPSNYYAFEEFAQQNGAQIEIQSPPDNFQDRGREWNRKILDAINKQTICVTLDHTHWQDGTIFDLQSIRKKCSENDALLIVDGTQSVGALPIDINELAPDALVCAGYKFLMGPYGSALSYFGDYFDDRIPIEFNWINRLHSDDFTSLTNYQENYRPKAFRYNVGEFSTYIHQAMLNEAIQQLIEWSPEAIQAYCNEITSDFFDTIREKGYAFDREGQARHLFGIYLTDNRDSRKLSEELVTNNIFVSVRGNAIRISPHVYNTTEDLMRLATFL